MRTTEAIPQTVSTDAESVFNIDSDGHAPFRDLCLIYGDFHRAVFLQEILNWFIRSASVAELSALRKAISARASSMSNGRKRGRPRAHDDADWVVGAKCAAWHRIVDEWTWRKIAEAEGVKVDKRNIRTIERTLSRRCDRYAAIIWTACSEAGIWKPRALPEANRVRLSSGLEAISFRQWLWIKAGLFGPSNDRGWIEGCKKIVLTLSLRGEKAAAEQLVIGLNYRMKRKGS